MCSSLQDKSDNMPVLRTSGQITQPYLNVGCWVDMQGKDFHQQLHPDVKRTTAEQRGGDKLDVC